MRVAIMLIAVACAACSVSADEGDTPTERYELPTCMSLGCRWSASSIPEAWIPCEGAQCWCDNEPGSWQLCSRVPCAADGTCAAGERPERTEYVLPPLQPGHPHRVVRACACVPDA